MTSDVLLDALDRLRGSGPEFEGFLANHGPMAAESLVHLGADAMVPGWVDAYRARLDSAPAGHGRIAPSNWRAHLGDFRLLGDWTQLLRREAQDLSWRALVVRWWPRLLPGMAASATHGVIRTAHAVRMLGDAGDAPHPLLVDELAQGLAYWAARYQTLPGSPALEGALDAVSAIRGLPRLDPVVASRGPGIAGRLVPLDDLPGFGPALDRWRAPGDPDLALDQLVSAAVRVLAARPDAPVAFCHAVTAPAAVRLVLPLLAPEQQAASVAASWQVVGAIVAAFAAPPRPGESDVSTGDAGPLLARLAPRAAEHGDEHVIKLTEAALREFARTRDTTLLVAADRFRDRVA